MARGRRYSHVELRERASAWAVRLRAKPRVIRIQTMTNKWGSCSRRGTVTLAEDLTQESSGFQDVVIVHELLHLRVRNHGKLFKALMFSYVPAWRACEKKSRLERCVFAPDR